MLSLPKGMDVDLRYVGVHHCWLLKHVVGMQLYMIMARLCVVVGAAVDCLFVQQHVVL